MPFFPIFKKKLLFVFPYFVQKRQIYKKHCSHVHILSKNVYPSKNTALPFLFFQIFHKKTLCCHAQVWLEERQFCHNDTILLAKKINRMPFFSDFELKNHSSHAHFLSKKRQFSKNNALMPIFCQKTSILPKTLRSHVYFFKYFIKNPMLSCPNLVKRTSILS